MHNVSFALKACITNWPKLFAIEDINDMFLSLINEDLKVFNKQQVINTLLIMSNEVAFREKYLNRFNVSALEIYLDAKDYQNVDYEPNNKDLYPLREIKIFPLYIQLNIKYIKPTDFFTNSEE
eukprot:483266_1